MPTARRSAAATVGLAALLLLAAPADAHVRVDGGSAHQGDRDVTLTFDAAAESTVAGIAALRVTTPAGIDGADVALVSAPTGWTLHTVAGGFEVGGPAAPAGEDVRYVVTVARLPIGRPRLAFPTDQRYEDGRVDHWTTVTDHPAGHAASAKGHPAPILELAAPSSDDNDPGTTDPAGSQTAGSQTAGSGTAGSGTAGSGGDGGAAGAAGGGSTRGAGDPTGKEDTAAAPPVAAAEPAGDRSGLLIGVGVAILAAAGAVAWLIRRRRPTGEPRP